MKKIATFLFFVSLTGMAFSQILIDSLNMPVPGQIVPRKSTGDPGSINYTATGASFTWDFRTLIPLQQAGDTFVNVTSTNLIYLTAFANPFNQAFMATVASPQSMQAIPMVTISDPYFFYKNSNAQFSLLGMGAKINNVPIPVKFDNPDVWYRFPVTFGSIDSSQSSFNISIPNLGYYGQDRRRTNEVDGWGTLYLPTDTFNVIRIKSTVHYQDTLHSDSLGFGIKINRTDIEYKWLSTAYSVPVCQITESTGGMGPGSTTAVFIDHTVWPNAIVENEDEQGVYIRPNPSDGHFSIDYAGTENTRLRIFSIQGKTVYESGLNGKGTTRTDISDLPSGIYLLNISGSSVNITKKIIVRH